MTRVSENSNTAALKFALNKTKAKVEDLQLKGATLRKVNRPSDDPMANVEGLTLSSIKSDNDQYLKNSDFALTQLNITESSIEQLTDILTKAKEIAIAQASDFYGDDIRKNVANEIYQLRNQALAIGNKRIGNKYIFSGHKSLTKPFNNEGKYFGDNGRTDVEVSKDFFLPINFHGEEVFFSSEATTNPNKVVPVKNDMEKGNGEKSDLPSAVRDLASIRIEPPKENFQKRQSIFSQLEGLAVGLENNDTILIQNLLENFDDSISRLISLRTKIGSISNSISNAKSIIESNNISGAERKSQLLDADIAELFADITQQESVLKTTYKANANIMNQTLLDFIR